MQRDPQMDRRNARTALWIGLLALAFVAAFVLHLWLR